MTSLIALLAEWLLWGPSVSRPENGHAGSIPVQSVKPFLAQLVEQVAFVCCQVASSSLAEGIFFLLLIVMYSI